MDEQTIVYIIAGITIAGMVYFMGRSEPPPPPPVAVQKARRDPKAFKHDDEGVILMKREDAIHLIEISPSGIERRVKP